MQEHQVRADQVHVYVECDRPGHAYPDMSNKMCLLVLRHDFAPVGAQTPVYRGAFSSCVTMYWQALDDLEAASIDNICGEMLKPGSKCGKAEVSLRHILQDGKLLNVLRYNARVIRPQR